MVTNASVPPLKQSASEHPNISGMTKAQLLAYAAENGIENVSGAMKKAEIIAAIEGAV